MSIFSPHLRRCSLTLACWLACAPLFAAEVTPRPLLGEGASAITSVDLVTETSTLDDTSRKRALSSPETVHRIATEMYVRRNLATQAQTQKLEEDPQTKHLLQIVRERVLADALAKRVEAQSRPTDPVLLNLAQQNYKIQKSRFQQPERIHVRHILIPLDTPNAREQANTLRQQIVAGENFEELARKYSKDPGSASQGGDLGFLPRGKMVKPLEDAAFALSQPGELSEVVESRFGYHVIQLVEKRGAGIQPFDEVKAQLMDEVAGGIAANARQELVRPLLESAKPHPDAIEAFSATYR